MPNLIDETGKRYGRLLVLSRSKNSKYGQSRWLCRCDCKNECIVWGMNLRKNHTTSCGCYHSERTRESNTKIIVEPNKVFGRLKVLKAKDRNKRGTITSWLCECSCSKKVVVKRDSLANGNSKSCGCARTEAVSLPKGEAAFNRLVAGMKAGAKVRNYSWNITDAQVRDLIQQNCHYCGIEPKQVACTSNKNSKTGSYIFNGLDRVDNTKGYLVENVVPCCKRCNQAKHAMTKDDFLSLASSIHNYSKGWRPVECQ